MAFNGSREHHWWQSGVIYQVYPRSFMDCNGDGIGDLQGITSRLDYLAWLGVDALWLSPICPSPMADFGYDVSDYKGVDPTFGTLNDFTKLLSRAHDLGLKVILDFVPNHTSDQHPWFTDSRASRSSPRRDWYIWRDPAPDGGPPNNWLSVFGGSAWEWDEGTGQYYYHAFLKQQPDLNWRNPSVEQAMLDAMRFWLELGVDGFRLDVIWHLVKDSEFRDNPPNPYYQDGQPKNWSLRDIYTTDRPEIHSVIAGMRCLSNSYTDTLLIGEIFLPFERLMTYYGNGGPDEGLHLPFNFHLLYTPWNAEAVGGLVKRYEASLPPHAWPNWVLGNHDRPRLASRLSPEQARVAAMLLLTLRGTPTLYYGDELGMQDVPIPPYLAQDPVEKSMPGQGRDPERTPMQWDGSLPYAGFSHNTPWLPLSGDYQTVNVASQSRKPDSILNLYRELLCLRRKEPALSVGGYRPVEVEGNVLAYLREKDASRWLVALNMGGELQARISQMG